MVREFSHQQADTDKKESKNNLFYVAAIVGPMLVVLIGILNARGSLDPLVFNTAVAGFTCAIFILLGFYLVVQPLRPKVERWHQESRREALSSEFLSQLGELVTQFGEVASSRYLNGIHVAIQSFRFTSLPSDPNLKEKGIEERWMQTLLGYHQTLVDSSIGQIDYELNHLKLGSKKFLLFHFAEIFRNLLWTYVSVFVRSYVEASKRVGLNNVPYTSKEAYAKFVPKFNQFISSYSKFAKNVNTRMELSQDQRGLGVYVEEAPPLL